MASRLHYGVFFCVNVFWCLLIYYLQTYHLGVKSSHSVCDIKKLSRDPSNDRAELTEGLDPFTYLTTQSSLLQAPAENECSCAKGLQCQCRDITAALAQSHSFVKISNRLSHNVQRLWIHLKKELGIHNVTESEKNILRSVMIDLQSLSETNRSANWKKREQSALQDLLQRRLEFLQNPANCSSARKMVFDLTQFKGCGYVCMVHHLVYSLMMAYGTQRTLILRSKGWIYANAGWDSVFLPLSTSCSEVPSGQEVVPWKDEAASLDDQAVMVRGQLTKRPPPYIPFSVPEDLMPRLRELTPEPAAWFAGQLLKYVLRPQPFLQSYLDEMKTNFGFKKPIVGIQVRRTDKITKQKEKPFSLEEYMVHVEAWFRTQEDLYGPIGTWRVYIASDTPAIILEARQRFPQYDFIGNTSMAGRAGHYTETSLTGVILDTYLLSLCDYVICTHSSNLCREAVEMKQVLQPSSSNLVYSLDDRYWFFGQHPQEEVAIFSHTKNPGTNEIDLEPGDEIIVDKRSNPAIDGYSKGINKRTKSLGLYPAYKTEEKLFVVKYPTYSEVGFSTN